MIETTALSGILKAGAIIAALAAGVWFMLSVKRAGRTEAERDQAEHAAEVKDEQLRAAGEAPRDKKDLAAKLRERGL